jgi:hypothetical protein
MTRRLWVFAVVLSLVALPVFAKRRAITPGGPSHCAEATLVRSTYADLLGMDAQFVYFVDEFGTLTRVPKLGGPTQELADPLDEWLPLSIAVDESYVYFGALPFEALRMPLPGAILRVPKTGGVVSVFVSGVVTPFEVATDATHLYWAAAGTLDFVNGTIAADGKIERIRKDGTGRQTLADDLSAPFGLAMDGTDVYFGQSGAATGDATMGMYRVAKTGGTTATIDDHLSVGPLVLDGNTLVFLGGTETEGGILAMEKTGGPVRTLYGAESVNGSLLVADRRAYFLEETDDGVALSSVSIDAPAGAVAVRADANGDSFLLDGCAAIVNTYDGDLVRTRR